MLSKGSLILRAFIFGCLLISSGMVAAFDPNDALLQHRQSQEEQQEAAVLDENRTTYERYKNEALLNIDQNGTVAIGNLQWMRCSLGQTWNGTACVGSATVHNWADANILPDLLNEQGGFAGHSDWRLPTIEELASLRKCSSRSAQGVTLLPGRHPATFISCSDNYDSPTMDTEAFPDNASGWYWSSTPDSGEENRVLGASFTSGTLGTGDVEANFKIRLVRGGVLLRSNSAGTGSGTIISSPPGIDCGSNCSALFAENIVVELSATSSEDSTFTGWSGACRGSTTVCTIEMTQARSVEATFNSFNDGRYLHEGDGSTVLDLETGLEWQRCSIGQNWTGSYCNGTAQSMDWEHAMQLGKDGWRLPTKNELRSLVFCSNTGQYDSNGNDEPCGQTLSFERPTINTLAFPNTPTSSYWSSTQGPRDNSEYASEIWFFNGSVSLNRRTSIPSQVRLVRGGSRLTVSTSGSGSGTISSNPHGIECPNSCSTEFAADLVVSLTPSASNDSVFAGWSGACSGTSSTCFVKMDQVQDVIATFDLLEGRFKLIGDGDIVLDKETGLEWQRCSVGQSWDGSNCRGSAREMSRGRAFEQEGGGWRLPTKEELQTIIYCSNTGIHNTRPNQHECVGNVFTRPTIDQSIFPNTQSRVSSGYWTSSLDTTSLQARRSNLEYSWTVNFLLGRVSSGTTVGSVHYVRLVRNGH